MATAALRITRNHVPVIEISNAPPVRSNEGDYIASNSVGRLEPTAIDTPLDEIRRRFNETGYVWVKDVIPREDVLAMREQ